jgi:hypothetical protein
LINRIYYHLNSNNLINENQYGFTAQKSTIDAIQSAIDFVNKTFESNGFSLLIALEISGAFDNAFWPVILNQLKKFWRPKNLFNLTKSYFNNRLAKLWFQNIEIIKHLSKGCPQGSSCGPCFWNLIIDGLLNLETPLGVKIQAFADDTLLMISSKTITELEAKANHMLEKIHQWSQQNKLEFNATKTTSVLFTRNLKFQKPKIIFDKNELLLSNSMQYLGVEIDNKLTSKLHINKTKTKALRLFMNLIKFPKNKFGLNRKALDIIYKGAVIPIISYGCPVWANAVNKNYIKESLEGLQRLAAIRICSAYKTVSTEALNVIANLIPIELRIKQIAVNYYIKKNIKSDLIQEFLQSDIDTDRIMRAIDVKTLPHPGLIVDIKQTYFTNDSLSVLTMGYKKQHMVGSAFSVITNQIMIKKSKYKLSSHCSSFQSELFAVSMALKYLTENRFNKSTTIYTNIIVINALKNTKSVTQLVQQILSKVSILYNHNIDIKFSDIQLLNNDEYYIITRELSKDGSIAHRSIDFDLIPYSYVKNLVTNENLNKWNQRWTQSTKGAITREYIPTIDYRHKIKNHFQTDFETTQLITNHGKFNDYLTRIKVRDNSRCDRCGTNKEDAKHSIYECEEYNEQRLEMRKNCDNGENQWPLNLKDLINRKNFPHFKEFCRSVFY